MTKKKAIFKVANVSDVSVVSSKSTKRDALTINQALTVVYQQMRIAGNRERTIDTYQYAFNQFVEHNKLIYVDEINIDHIYNYLDSLNVSQQTKLTRLKSVKSILSRFFNNGYIQTKFWATINIKVDKKINAQAKQNDIEILLSLLDKNSFIGFRDTVAILILLKTGIRINTLAQLKERHVDLDNLFLNLDGSILKNHNFLKLPIDEELTHLISILIQQNNLIREYYQIKNSNIFITQKGLPVSDAKSTNNAISKQLSKYAKRYNLKNINPHAIRRLYAKNLLDKGANIAIISKALGHSNLAVTTQYLDLDTDEVADNLREYL